MLADLNEQFINACACLDLQPETFSQDELKRQYRLMALKYHPDKNKSENASQQFQDIQNAYEYLNRHCRYENDIYRERDSDDDTSSDEDMHPSSPAFYYGNVLHSFMKNVLSTTMGIDVGDSTNALICSIVSKIMDIGEIRSLEYLKKVDKHVLLKIYDVMCKYKDVLHMSESFLEKVKELVAFKFENDECIILNPFIDDLFHDKVYKLKENGQTYIVPLWHHELVYDNSGSDLYVKCIPLLPENAEIDANNNIHICSAWNIKDIWETSEISVWLGSREIRIPVKDLRILKYQTITLREKGISRINSKNIYDVQRRGDIVLHIDLTI